MKKWLIWGGILMSGVFAAGAVSAGYVFTTEVIIQDPGPGVIDAAGDTATAHDAFDDKQAISCWVAAVPGVPAWMACVATNREGRSISCYSDAPSLVQAATYVTSESYINFTTSTDGSCTSLQVENGSVQNKKQR